jgi:hypothetical protein
LPGSGINTLFLFEKRTVSSRDSAGGKRHYREGGYVWSRIKKERLSL